MQREFIDNWKDATIKFIRKHGKPYYNLLMNTWYGMCNAYTDGYEYRRINIMFKDADMMPLNKEASFDSVIEWNCQVFLTNRWWIVPSDIDKNLITITSPKNEDYLADVFVVWPHDDKFEMFDRVLAPRGFNKNGFPTPTMLDVVTRERHSKAAHRSYMTSKNAQNRALLWEQENENNE